MPKDGASGKKPTRRSQKKYPALDPRMNLKSRHELLDYDYIHKLDEDAKAWLNQFSEEYINASFNTKQPRKNLHKTKKLRQDCYNRNNARNRDIFTKAKAAGLLSDISVVDNLEAETDRVDENSVIEVVDKKLAK